MVKMLPPPILSVVGIYPNGVVGTEAIEVHHLQSCILFKHILSVLPPPIEGSGRCYLGKAELHAVCFLSILTVNSSKNSCPRLAWSAMNLS